jgi:hypothetical protein
MSKGKYLPAMLSGVVDNNLYIYNAKGQSVESRLIDIYDEELDFPAYDIEGYDRYGYSAYLYGSYVGYGRGLDKNGYTANEYAAMSDEDFADFS